MTYFTRQAAVTTGTVALFHSKRTLSARDTILSDVKGYILDPKDKLMTLM